MRLLTERISSYPTMVYPDEKIVQTLAGNGFYYDDETRLSKCYECEGIDEIHREGCFIPRFNRMMTDKEESTDYSVLSQRISTFRDGWKGYYGCETNWDRRNDYVSSPDEIACAGFIYDGTADHLRCPFCSIVVRFSTHKRISIAEHRKLNPFCSFVNNTIENFEK